MQIRVFEVTTELARGSSTAAIQILEEPLQGIPLAIRSQGKSDWSFVREPRRIVMSRGPYCRENLKPNPDR